MEGAFRGKRTLYIPNWVEGGEWNHARAVCGPEGLEEEEGEGGLDTRRARERLTSVSTASSESSLSEDDAEPDNESSSSVIHMIITQ